MNEKTMEQDGFFEGVYDYLPNLRHYVNPENAHQYLPRLGRFDLSSARPELFGFLGAVDRHLGRLSMGYIKKIILYRSVDNIGMATEHPERVLFRMATPSCTHVSAGDD